MVHFTFVYFSTKKKKKKVGRISVLISGRRARRAAARALASGAHGQAAVLRPSQVGEKTEWSRDAGPQTSDSQPCALALHHSGTIKLTINTFQ